MKKIIALIIVLVMLNGCSSKQEIKEEKNEEIDNNINKEEVINNEKEEKDDNVISGIVLDIDRNRITMKDKNIGVVIVKFENELDKEILINNYIEVKTTGISTKSIPPQMVGVELLKNELRDTFKGEIIKKENDSITIKKEDSQQIIVSLENIIKNDFSIGDNVKVTTNGINSASLPPKTVAIEINKVLTTKELVEKVFNQEIIDVLTDSNNKITLNEDDLFVVFLNENPSTGYIYDFDISNVSNGLEFIKEEVVKEKKDTILLGQSINKAWLFNALKEGEYNLEFKLVSPEKEVVDIIKFSIIIRK